MKFPAGLEYPNPKSVCLLKKSIYGLKQASRQWYARLAVALTYKGYTSSLNDYSLFYVSLGELISIAAVYVDDILISGNDVDEIQQIQAFLHKEFKVKNLGEINYFFGKKILREKHGFIISQRKFTLRPF